MRKFTEIKNNTDWEVLTDTGYQPIEKSNVTIPYQVYSLITDNYELECADDHIVFDQNYNEVFVKDLKPGMTIQTESGLDKVISIEALDFEEPMYDLSLPDETDHRYYTGGILSHNTTVLLELLSKLHDAGRRVLFISAEMNQIDMARYLKRFPNWGQLPILFLGDYSDSDPKSVIEQTINEGWDLVLTDSYTEVNDTVKEESNMTRSKTEKWFLNLMSENNKANNEHKLYTTFITILQMNKGGVFQGSNKLKHLTTSMMHMNWDGNENSSRRYIEFSKNRVGQVNKKLYYSLDNGVEFDEARYARDLFNDVIVEEERKQLSNEADSFDKLFGFGDFASKETEETETSVESVEAV